MCYDPRMRRPRGNIILTALFVAVFLFFLSVALVWTNRQDISLTLTMEHKMKAEAAARSGAHYVYGALRATGRPPAVMEKTLDSGAQWKVQLVRIQPERRRGHVLLLRSRGRSGPVSSYITFHLLESRLSSDTPEAKNRLLVFHGSSSSQSTETEENSQPPVVTNSGTPGGVFSSTLPTEGSSEGQGQERPTTVLPPDFIVQSVKMGLPQTGSVIAQDGPIFASERPELQNGVSAFSVLDSVPVFPSSGGAPQAFGPIVINLLAPSDRTELRVLQKKGANYEWEAIPDPVELGSNNTSTSTSTAQLAKLEFSSPSDDWKGVTLRAIDGQGTATSWTDGNALAGKVITSYPAEGNQEWSGASIVARAVTLRGVIASQGETVYSHAWQYLYLRYSGSGEAPPLPVQVGSRIIRWPCIVKYDANEKKWEFAWNPLKDNGDLTSQLKPHPDKLWVDSKAIYGVSSSNTNELLKLEPNGDVSSEGVLHQGQVVLYQNKPYTVSSDLANPGLVAAKDGARIDFKSLPDRIPAIIGPVYPAQPVDILGPLAVSNLEISEFSSEPVTRTVRRQETITYSIPSTTSIVASGTDLYLNLEPKVEIFEADAPRYGDFEIGIGTSKVLARYDGQRWHILPNGLMASLQGMREQRETTRVEDSRTFQTTGQTGVNSPGDQFFLAQYEGMPDPANRYTVVSISTDPFEFEE